MGFLDPYAIKGATITAGQLRRQVYATTKGATGVDGPEDLAVVAVPGSPGIAGIMPGGGVVGVQSRRESYSVTNPAMDGDALVAVPTAGSSGATHYVIVEITDPEYHGQEAEAGATPMVVASISGRTRPFLPLARIELEAGETFGVTSTVVDLRRVAVPLKERHLRAYQLYIADSEALTTASIVWPTIANTRLWVPEWARGVNIAADWATVRGTGPAAGVCYVRFAGGGENQETQHSRWQAPDAAESRFGIKMADHVAVPAALRGREVTFHMMATKTETGPNVYVDGMSSIVLDVEFVEERVRP